MACCGNRKAVRTNGKVCPRCGWVMNRVHKYDSNTRKVVKYWLCSNTTRRSGAAGGACAFRETIK